MLDILLPAKRSKKLKTVAESIKETTRTPYLLTFIIEEEDTETVKSAEGLGDVLTGTFGTPAKAINYGFKKTNHPYFIFANDDFVFQPNWDTNAFAKMTDGKSVIAINDGSPSPQWGTITLSRRSYVNDHGGTENKGEVFHEGYTHNYVDTEYWERATQQNVTDVAPDSVIIHEHPAFGYEADTVHKKPKNTERDSQIFMERRRQYL